MFSGKRTSKKISAKIQITLYLAVCLFANSACIRKDLYLRVDTTQISIQMFDVGLDLGMELLWGFDWKTAWHYEWDETNLATFGPIGYTKPDLVKTTIYNIDNQTGKRYSSFYMLFDAGGGRLRLTSGSTYDMLFYNFGTEYINFYQSEDYYTYNAYTRVSNQATFIRTRAENVFSEMPDTMKTYVDYNQPDELVGTVENEIVINEDPSNYYKEYDSDGNVTYVYRIDATLRPYSFIYLIQMVILNNKESEEKGNRIVGASGLTITGLSQGTELFSRKTLRNTISTTTTDVKYMQNHDIKDPQDTTQTINVDIMASRLLTWGLPGIDPYENWNDETGTNGAALTPIEDNYIGIGFTLRNGYSWTITKRITDQMWSKPTGGVITIYVDASQIPQELLDKQQTSGGGGFNASVEDWSNEVNAEVSI